MTDVLRFVFIELGRFKKRLWELESVLDKWLYLFKHIHELTSIPDEFQIPTFRRLFLLSEIGNFAPEEYEQYLSSMGEFSDYYNTIDTAAEEAEKRVHARGLKMSAEPCEGKAFASALLDFIQQSAGFVQESGGLLFCRGEFLPLERKNQVKI